MCKCWKGSPRYLENFLLIVGTVSDVDQVTQLRGVDLLVLGGHQQRSDAHELELRAAHTVVLEEAVDDVHGKVQRLGNHLELQVHLHKPVHQDGAHALVDIGLAGHILSVHHDTCCVSGVWEVLVFVPGDGCDVRIWHGILAHV